MPIELKIPAVGESVSEVEIGSWQKAEGDSVRKDEAVATLESEKATVELPAPADGVLGRILKKKGETAAIGEVIGYLNETGAKPAAKAGPAQTQKNEAPAAESPTRVMPAAQRVLGEQGVSAAEVKGTGPGGRILKEDALRATGNATAKPGSAPASPAPSAKAPSTPSAPPSPPPLPRKEPAGRDEEIVPMTRLRRTLAERLVEAQRQAALLTTFNEIDMSAVLAMRKEHGESFQQKHGVKLGFMSFFVKAAVDALKRVPQVNAEIRGTQIVYKNYYDIGVAVGGGKGLVVPVLRNAERMSFAEVEIAIGDLARRARDNALKLEELQGGTFTISNGGVYGSLLSTPIVNPPQSGILGMHAMQDRPVAREGQVVIRPMMYVALTYDHRIVDGREAVTFLKRIKDAVETPLRMFIEV